MESWDGGGGPRLHFGHLCWELHAGGMGLAAAEAVMRSLQSSRLLAAASEAAQGHWLHRNQLPLGDTSAPPWRLLSLTFAVTSP